VCRLCREVIQSSRVGSFYRELLVMEPDYLLDLKVFVFSRVYNPWRLYTPEECTPLHTRELQGGISPPVGSGGKRALEGKIAL
jgi:hypothetical protein